jgi:hypothetical protein
MDGSLFRGRAATPHTVQSQAVAGPCSCPLPESIALLVMRVVIVCLDVATVVIHSTSRNAEPVIIHEIPAYACGC